MSAVISPAAGPGGGVSAPPGSCPTPGTAREVSIPVPRGILTETWSEAVDALNRIGAPVVVKPLDGRQGKGVSLNLAAK